MFDNINICRFDTVHQRDRRTIRGTGSSAHIQPCIQGAQLALSDKWGKGEINTFYTVFTPRLISIFINVKYSFTPMASSVVTLFLKSSAISTESLPSKAVFRILWGGG